MFSRKNTIIIALIAMFVLGTIVLHAESINLRVNNIYRYNYGPAPVHFDADGWSTGDEVRLVKTNIANEPNSYVTWYGVPIVQDVYYYTASQAERSVGGVFYYSQNWEICTLPGPVEPIPSTPAHH